MQAKAARFSASVQSTDWFASCCTRGARLTVAQDGRRGDPWPYNHAGSGECRMNPVGNAFSFVSPDGKGLPTE